VVCVTACTALAVFSIGASARVASPGSFAVAHTVVSA
jgi:hypothetical protein